jgi:dTDP-4-amino-4,6-dideoxygalactose transaminase
VERSSAPLAAPLGGGPGVDSRGGRFFHLFMCRSAARRSQGVPRRQRRRRHHHRPAHLQAPYREYGAGLGSLPQTERLAEEILSLPIHPELPDDDVDYVASQVRAFSASHGT